MSIEEKGKWVILINFILFPIGLIVYNALTFETKNYLVEYVNPVAGSCPENYDFRQGYCYLRNCKDNMQQQQCERVSINCPTNKEPNPDNENDTNCYTKIFYVNPSEPFCPDTFYRSGDICLPFDVKLEEHEVAKVPLRCEQNKVLKNHKCFNVSETGPTTSQKTRVCTADDQTNCIKREL